MEEREEEAKRDLQPRRPDLSRLPRRNDRLGRTAQLGGQCTVHILAEFGQHGSWLNSNHQLKPRI